MKNPLGYLFFLLAVMMAILLISVAMGAKGTPCPDCDAMLSMRVI